MHAGRSQLTPAEDVEEDPVEIRAACAELAETVAELVAELGSLAEKSGAVADNVIALVDPADRRLAGFAAGLDSLSREVVPDLEALSRVVVSQAEQLARATTRDGSRRPRHHTRATGKVTLARLARLNRQARRARTWSVFDRSYHQGRAAAFDAFGDRLAEAVRLLTYVQHELSRRTERERMSGTLKALPPPPDAATANPGTEEDRPGPARAVDGARLRNGQR